MHLYDIVLNYDYHRHTHPCTQFSPVGVIQQSISSFDDVLQKQACTFLYTKTISQTVVHTSIYELQVYFLLLFL